jgi:hypothetical protein
MDNPMVLMMLMTMLMQMFNQGGGGGLQGKQKDRSQDSAGNLLGAGFGQGSNPANPGQLNPNNPLPNPNPNTLPVNPSVPNNSNPANPILPIQDPFFAPLGQ